MKNIKLVAIREFLTNVKKKSFVIMTFAAPFLFAALIAVVAFMFKANQTQSRIAVIDNSTLLTKALHSSDKIVYNFYGTDEEKAIHDTLATSENLDGLLVIPKLTDSTYTSIEKGVSFYTNKNIGEGTQNNIKNSIEEELKNLKIKKYNFNKKELEKLKSEVSFVIKNVKSGDEESNGSPVKKGISMVLLFFIYTFILIYGMRVMRSVMEEKSSRVVEIIISSLKPFDLMMGKILGTTLVAFFQFIIWIFLGGIFILLLQGLIDPSAMTGEMMKGLSQNMNVQEKMPDILILTKEFGQLNIFKIMITFLFYFVMGYIFYSSLLASIGAAVDSETETQQFMPIILIPMIIGMYGSIFISENPEGPVAFWLSMIPLTSPIGMVARIPYDVPWWELGLSMLILLVTTILMVKLAGKIYKTGILMYGKKTNFKEIWKWIRM